MLREIYCEEFHQKKISLKQGLNVVLGTNTGDNSIGKSTFLLIIDFVLGGSAYANSNDILHNVKEHDIFFSFFGENNHYYFARNNISSNIIWVCDENYNKIRQIDIVEYKEWLNNYYQLQLPSLSFRDSVGRYIRVYGKENYNEKRPLNYTAKEADKKACYALLKLFDRYTPVAQVQVQADNSADALKAYKKAQALAYIENIGKREFLKNVKEIERLELELKQLITKLDEGLLDLDSVVSEQALEIKENLSKARRLRGMVLSRLKSINDNYGYAFSLSENSLAELQKYFPYINLEELEKIEDFHLQISTIFKAELKEQKVKLLKDLSGYDKLIEEYEEKLKSLTNFLKHAVNRKKWRYMGVWERGNATERLHFHALVYIPDGQMIGELIEKRDYSTKQKRMQTTIQNTHLNEKFGRTDFEKIVVWEQRTQCYQYIKKYMEKSGEKMIVSRNCPTHYNMAVFEDDILAPMIKKPYHKIMFPNFTGITKDGEVIDDITPEKLLALFDEKRI